MLPWYSYINLWYYHSNIGYQLKLATTVHKLGLCHVQQLLVLVWPNYINYWCCHDTNPLYYSPSLVVEFLLTWGLPSVYKSLNYLVVVVVV